MRNARAMLPQVREEMEFAGIKLTVTARQRHWLFYDKDGTFLVQYWPARSLARISGAKEDCECKSAKAAGALAIVQQDLLRVEQAQSLPEES